MSHQPERDRAVLRHALAMSGAERCYLAVVFALEFAGVLLLAFGNPQLGWSLLAATLLGVLGWAFWTLSQVRRFTRAVEALAVHDHPIDDDPAS